MPAAWAGPTGGQVVGGQAVIQSLNQETLIKQSTNKAIINWNAFSILRNESVVFQQPNAQSIALNRVLGGSPSAILGTLTANGQVWLVNPNGVLFGKAATVNATGLLATTADIANSDFLTGNYSFGIPSSNPNAGVANYGTIDTEGGSTVLAAPNVDNAGTIEARLGTVAVGAGSTFAVDFDGDNVLSFAVKTPAAKGRIDNAGTIAADGGTVELSARAAGNIVDNVINTSGIVQANSVSIQNGTVILDAGQGGSVNVSGTVSAAGTAAGTTGGTVKVLGRNVALAPTASVAVSGAAGGGTVVIGGDFHGAGPDPNATNTSIAEGATIAADALNAGNGGNVAVWSQQSTSFNGGIGAQGGPSGGNGGYVETSSAADLSVGTGRVNTRALKGLIGSWLLDPANGNVVVAASGGTITTASIDNSTANVTIQSNGGDITFQDAVSMSNNGVGLTAEAGNSIFVNAGITTKGGGITLSANDPNEAPSGNGSIQLNAALNTAGNGQTGGNVLLTLNGASGGSISLGAPITTDQGSIAIDSQALLTNNITLDSTDGGVGNGADVTFGGTLDDSTPYTHNLTITAGFGDVNFDGRVGYNNPTSGGTAAGTPPGAVTITANNVNLDMPYDAPNGNGFDVGSLAVQALGSLNVSQAYISTYNPLGNGGNVSIAAGGDVFDNGILDAAGGGNGGNGGTVNITAGGSVTIMSCCTVATFGTTGTGDEQIANTIGIYTGGFSPSTTAQTAGNGGSVTITGSSIDLPMGINANGGNVLVTGSTANGGNAGNVTLTANAGNVAISDPLDNGSLEGLFDHGGDSIGGTGGAGGNVSITASNQISLTRILTEGGSTGASTGAGAGGNITLAANATIGPAVIVYGEAESAQASFTGIATLTAFAGANGVSYSGTDNVFHNGGTLGNTGGSIAIGGTSGALNGSSYIQLVNNTAAQTYEGGATIYIGTGGTATGSSANISIDGPIEGTNAGAEALRVRDLGPGGVLGVVTVNGGIGDQVPLGYVSLAGGTTDLNGNITTKPGALPEYQVCSGSPYTCSNDPATYAGDVYFNGAVTLAKHITVNTIGGDPFGSPGGNITFGNDDASPVNGPYDLSLETGGSGSTGTVSFDCSTGGCSNIGGSTPLTGLLIRSGGNITLQNVTTTGSQYYATGNPSSDNIYLNQNLSANDVGSDIQFLGNVDALTRNINLTADGSVSGGEIYISGTVTGDASTLRLNATNGLIVYDGAILANPSGTVQGCPSGVTCAEGLTQTLSGTVDTGAINQNAHILLTGNTTFENASANALTVTPTIDSGNGTSYTVTFQQQSGTTGGIALAGTVGDAGPLGSLTIVGTSGPISLNSVGSPVLPGLYGTLSINGEPTTLGGAIGTRDGEVDIGGPVTLAANLAIDTTLFDSGNGAAINFASTIDDSTAGAHSLRLNAGDYTITLGGSVGDSTPLGAVSIVAHGPPAAQGCVTSLCLFGDITTLNGRIRIDAPTYLDGNVTLSTMGNTTTAAGADIVLSSNTTVDADPSANLSPPPNFALNAGTGAITVGANLGGNDALGNVTLTSGSRINLGGNITTDASTGPNPTGAVTIDGPVVLTNPVTIDTTDNGNFAGANISFSGTIDGTSTGNQWLILKANDTPQADLDNPGNCCNPTNTNVAGEGPPSTNGGTIILNGNLGDQIALGEVEMTGSQLNVGGDITTSGGQISAFGPMVLTNPGLATFSTGSGPVNLFYTNTLDGTTPGAQALTINSYVTAVLPPAVGGTTPLGALTVFGPVEVHGSVTTAGGAIGFYSGGTVFLDSTLDTTANNTPGGADIYIGGPLASGNPIVNLTLNGGTGGVVSLYGDVGDGTPFATVMIDAGQLNLGGNITTNGGGLAVQVNPPTVLENSVTIDTSAGNGNILFGRTDAASAGLQGLTLKAGSGDIDLGNGAPVGGITPLGAVTLTSSNVQFFSGIATANGAITINGGNTLVYNSTTLDTTAGGTVAGAPIVIGGTINENYQAGQHSLLFEAGSASVSVNGAVGNTLPVGTLTIAGKGIALGDSIATTGALTLNGGSGAITAPVAIDAGAFILQGGNWSQVAGTLPAFAATDFELQGGTFVRALSGNGSTASPYQITDVYGLQGVGTLLNDNFVMANAIDAAVAGRWNSGAGFMPIGNDNTGSFTGGFNGQGNAVSNLTINSSLSAVGLFGTNGGTVSNVILANATVSSSGNTAAAGALTGVNTGTIANSSATGSVTGTASDGGDAMLGGLVGYNNGGTINGGSFANVTVADNANYGDDYLGGLVGRSNGTIAQTYATGAITGKGAGVDNGWGGLVGALDGGTIDQSYALGGVTNNSGDVPNVGGLVGKQNAGSITNSYASGAVVSDEADSSIFIGGLVGWQTGGTVASSYSVGLVQCPNNGCSQGGLIGVGGGTVDALSFWDIDSSGQSTSAGGVGLTTAQAQNASYLQGLGWRFSGDSPWRIHDGSSYPYLQWYGSATPVSEIVSGSAPGGSTVDLIIDGTPIRSTTAAANGAYQFLLTSGTTGTALVYLPSGAADAVSALTASGGAGLNLTNGNTVYLTGQGGTVATSNLATAEGSASGSGILYGVGGTTIVLNSGIALTVAGGAGGALIDDAVATSGGGAVTVSGASIALAANISTGNGAITLTGPVTLTGSAPLLTLDTTVQGASGANIALNGTADAQNGQGLSLNGGTGGTVTIGGVVGRNSPNGFGPVTISAANIDLNAAIDTAGQPVTLDGQLVFASDVTVGTTADNHPNGANITVNGTPAGSGTIDPTLTLDGGTAGAVNGSVNLGQGYFLALDAGSSALNGTVNGASGSTAAQYVTVSNSCSPCTMNGVADGSAQQPPPPPPSSPSSPADNGAAQTVAQSNPNTSNPNNANQPPANQTAATEPTQEAVVVPQNVYEPPPAYDPSETDAPTTVAGIDSGASLFVTISPTSSTDLTVDQSTTDQLVVAYANPPPVKPAANADPQRPPVVNPVAAYLNRMVTPTMPNGGVPGISFGYSLSGNSALW